MSGPNGLHVDHQPREWQCTKRDAVWCPLCGDCTCGKNADAKITSLNNACPLHGRESGHPTRAELVLSRPNPKRVLL